jgi:DNA-binding TFAR19-related protein (PDSD5 family)
MGSRWVDGDRIFEQPWPATKLETTLKRLRELKKRAGNRVCTPQQLQQYRDAKSDKEKRKLDREHDSATRKSLGPEATSRLMFLEAVAEKAGEEDENGLRWLTVVSRVKRPMGREVESWPSVVHCPKDLRKEVLHAIMHDWDMVMCHFSIVVADIGGVLALNVEERLPTIYKYNRASEECILKGLTSKDDNSFLAPIAKWYGVSADEAKPGCLTLLNQGVVKSWLSELEPPQEEPEENHPDVIGLMSDARKARELYFEHAATLFPGGTFDKLKARLMDEKPEYRDGTPRQRSEMERRTLHD